jgi:hypothetical protein
VAGRQLVPEVMIEPQLVEALIPATVEKLGPGGTGTSHLCASAVNE